MANESSLSEPLPADPVAGSNTDEERTDEETEACYESDDFPVLESQLVTEASPNPPISAVNPDEVVWSARNSFTADSPYFDAFLDSETASLSTLSQALNCIAARTRTFVKQGAIMSEATRRLGLACKLRSNDYDATSTAAADDEAGRSDELVGATTEEELVRQKRNAVGEEMAGILELLGEVRRPLDETGFNLSRLESHLRLLWPRCTPLAAGFRGSSCRSTRYVQDHGSYVEHVS
jgi:hypothetical protein